MGGGKEEVSVSGRREVLWVSKRGKGPLLRIEKNVIKRGKGEGNGFGGKGERGWGEVFAKVIV